MDKEIELKEVSWKDVIRKKAEVHETIRQKIQSQLTNLLSELRQSPYNIKTECELIDNTKLIWEVHIHTVTFTISSSEIKNMNTNEDVKKELEKLIEKKFDYNY